MRRAVVLLVVVIGLVSAPLASAETSATGRVTFGHPFWQVGTSNTLTVTGSAPAETTIDVHMRKAALEPCAPDHVTDRSYNGTVQFGQTSAFLADPFSHRTASYSMTHVGDRGLWRACIYLIHTDQQTPTVLAASTFTFRVAPPCVVPRLRGLTIAQAKVALTRAGCGFKALRSVDGSGLPTGRVVSSLPIAGRRLPPMTRVTLVFERA